MHMLGNASNVVNWMQPFFDEEKIRISIDATDIVDVEANTPMSTKVLGMLWILIHCYAVKQGDAQSEKGLLSFFHDFVRQDLYREKGVNISDLDKAWANGMAFCAVLHRMKPSCIDFESLDPANSRENLELAFRTAEEVFNIPQLLDPEV